MPSSAEYYSTNESCPVDDDEYNSEMTMAMRRRSVDENLEAYGNLVVIIEAMLIFRVSIILVNIII